MPRQLLAEGHARPMQARLHRADRFAKDLRRLLVRELFHVTEDEDRAVVRGEHVQGALQGAAMRALTPAWTCAADIEPFRLSNEPYVIYDGKRLPFGEGTFDTTLISLVLHHSETPEPVLAEAVRVTRTRLLVVESVYQSRLERWLELLDERLNRHRHDGRMPVPLAFKPPEEWRALFESHGLAVVAIEWLGSWIERLSHHPLLFVMDKSPGWARCASSGQHREPFIRSYRSRAR